MQKKAENIILTQSLERKLILASHNAGKISEMRSALQPFGWTLTSSAELNLTIPEENGASFHDNAHIKALAASNATGLIALADDSGLEVHCLNERPGLHTATYGGWEKLLHEMKAIPEPERQARFICVLALHIPHQTTLFFEGICDGEITLESSGAGGFGYDPVFRPAGETLTFAEMSQQEKQAHSHRGKAIRSLLEALKMISSADHA
ncbi:MAG: non-canonical purine NTP pyrophosphatase, RdgB/HAM1 family [Pseudomonas fluorescens]|nr:MAG: non-canonical purine NTP pyrophosphatase, RdgB/HAM1 family [Pseudomonas fluorescens]